MYVNCGISLAKKEVNSWQNVWRKKEVNSWQNVWRKKRREFMTECLKKKKMAEYLKLKDVDELCCRMSEVGRSKWQLAECLSQIKWITWYSVLIESDCRSRISLSWKEWMNCVVKRSEYHAKMYGVKRSECQGRMSWIKRSKCHGRMYWVKRSEWMTL